MVLPASCQGAETDPLQFFAAIEELAKSDAQHGLVRGPGVGMFDRRRFPGTDSGEKYIWKLASRDGLGTQYQ